jgi:hypothetical protein
MKARKEAKRLRQLGRPKKEGVARYENGRIVRAQDRETNEDATRTVREARQRHLGVRMKDAHDPKHGDPLKALLMAGRGEGITQEQYSVGEQWARLYRQHCRIAKGLSPDPPSPAAMMLDIAPHRDLAHPEAEPFTGATYLPDEAKEAAVERAWAESYHALMRHGYEHGVPSPYGVLLAVAGRDMRVTNERELGNLRIALNILMHLWKRERRT